MIELIGQDLFDQVSSADVICISTNCTISDDGTNPMGGGSAGAARRLWPTIDYIYGTLLRSAGHVPLIVGYVSKKDRSLFYVVDEFLQDEVKPGGDWCAVVAYPTMHSIMESASIDLVVRSAVLLSEMADTIGWARVIVGRPGAGIGGLDWETEVKPALKPILDDRFVLIHKEFSRPKSAMVFNSTSFSTKKDN